MKFPDDFNVKNEYATFNDIDLSHSRDKNVAPAFSHYNRKSLKISGKSKLKITVKKESLIQYFSDSGFLYTKYGKNADNQLIEHYSPVDQHNIDVFINEMIKNFNGIIKIRYPHASGSLDIFDEPTPTCHLFFTNQEGYVPEYVPHFSAPLKKEAEPEIDDKNNEEQGPLAPISNNHLKAEHMLESQLQQDNGHDDDNNSEQVKPSTPPKPDNNDNSALQQAVKQQTEAIDEEEKAHQKSLLANATHSNDDAQSKSPYADLLRRQDEEKARLDALNADTKRKMKENRQRRNNNRNRNNQNQNDADKDLDR